MSSIKVVRYCYRFSLIIMYYFLRHWLLIELSNVLILSSLCFLYSDEVEAALVGGLGASVTLWTALGHK